MADDFWVPSLVGQVFDGYLIGDRIGSGHFGLVFEATETSTEAGYAIKVLPPSTDVDAPADFDNEGVLLNKLLKCSGVIDLIASGTATVEALLANAPVPVPLPFKYHILERADGDLEELIEDPAKREAVSWLERMGLWRSAVKSVHQMHLNQVAHRDLKSSNCLLLVDGNVTTVNLADLGRSKDFSKAPRFMDIAYLTGRGDLSFAPPEFLWHQGGMSAEDFRAADLYGLGSLLVELATGHSMTSLAVGAWRDAVAEGMRDFASGNRRDLGVLRPQFHRAVDEVAEHFPRVIRHEATVLLKRLCDPVPSERHPRRIPTRRYVHDDGLLWLLRKGDILSRRLSVRRPPRH